MTVDPFTLADPLYQHAIQRGNRNRHIPITPSRDGVGGFVKVLAGFACWAFVIGFLCRLLWSF